MELLDNFIKIVQAFLKRIINGHESSIYQYEPEKKEKRTKEWLSRRGKNSVKAKTKCLWKEGNGGRFLGC